MSSAADTLARPRTLFTVRGVDPVVLEVTGRLDAGAVAGFRAVADWLLGSRAVTLDLRECETVGAGDDAVAAVVGAVSAAGGTITVQRTA